MSPTTSCRRSSPPSSSPGWPALTRTLSDGDRDVYDLVINAEMSHEETAQILSIPVGTVKSRLHRVRRQLNEAAARDHEEVKSRCLT